MKVVAGNIKNLTDARYFAAWYVDALIYTMDEVTLEEVKRYKEMINWVEGPAAILHADHISPHDRYDIMKSMDAEGLSSSENQPKALYIYMDHRVDITNPNQSQIWKFKLTTMDIGEIANSPNNVYIGYPQNDLATVMQLYKDLGHVGIYVEGGAEDKVGLKAYDDLDQLLELLSEEEMSI